MSTRRAIVAAGLVSLVVSAVLLGPFSCVGYCVDDEVGSGACITECDTVLGYGTPLPGDTWLVVPAALTLAFTYWVTTRPRGR